jgi:hypothetical protein
VDLVDDHGPEAGEHAALVNAARDEHHLERLGRGEE